VVKGRPKMNCGEHGKYGDMQKLNGQNKYDRDHLPSKAALQQLAKDILRNNKALAKQLTAEGRASLFGDQGVISKMGEVVAIPKRDHQRYSRTYGKRNTQEQIKEDAKDLQKATGKDAKAIEEAEGKQMDDECAKKYRKVAENLRKKTHEEYVNEITDQIKDVIKNQKKSL
jgi:glutamate/tyrosine decarboxylase-like PLP-dependent enzyme